MGKFMRGVKEEMPLRQLKKSNNNIMVKDMILKMMFG